MTTVTQFHYCNAQLTLRYDTTDSKCNTTNVPATLIVQVNADRNSGLFHNKQPLSELLYRNEILFSIFQDSAGPAGILNNITNRYLMENPDMLTAASL